jgi:carboxypeptidase D
LSIASLSWDVIQEQVVALDFVKKYQNVFAFKYDTIHSIFENTSNDVTACSQTFLAHLDQKAKSCNYTGYYDKYVKYPPPPAPFPLPGGKTTFAPGCDIWDEIFEAAVIINPAFNVYRIFDTYPVLWDVLGFP